MTTQVISKSELIDVVLVKYQSEMNQFKNKITFFERKYKSSFSFFERKIKRSPENFEKWDDYIEWQAYLQSFNEIMKKIKSLKCGDYKIT